MFAFGESGKPAAKCFVSYGPLPRFIDPKEPPRRKKPFSAILKNPFFHTVELCLPEEVYLVVQDQLQIDKTQPKYLRVIMPLGALLEREFLNGYIKEGNIMMLSEGRAGIDNVFSLKEGILHLALDKATYERCGLVGKLAGLNRSKRGGERFNIDIDLRLPAMVHGKKGFQRLVWAAENVLTLPIQWIICNNGGDMSSLSAALARHHPIETHADPRVSISPSLLEPDFLRNDPLHDSFPEFLAERVVELREWLALVSLGSPRVEESDSIDPFLSRYQVSFPKMKGRRMVNICWAGLLGPSWVTQLWLNLLFSVRSSSPNEWFSLSVYPFKTHEIQGENEYTIMRLPMGFRWGGFVGQEALGIVLEQHNDVYILWETTH